jgi:hypothetical protein
VQNEAVLRCDRTAASVWLPKAFVHLKLVTSASGPGGDYNAGS